MKKLFMLLFLSLSLFTVNAQTDTTDLKSQIYSDVKEVIVSLSSALQVGTEKVWDLLVAQQPVNSWINIVVFIALLVLCFVSARLFIWASNEDYDILMVVAGGTAVLLGVSTAIFLLCSIQPTVIGFTNPEYGALKEIMNLIRSTNE